MLQTSLPRFTVPVKPQAWAVSNIAAWDWVSLPALPPLILADGSGPAIQQTTTRICHDGETFYARFDCEDDDSWGTFHRRDDPIYDEEVVELFIAAGEETPTDYYEFEISPNGVLFDAKVHNPGGGRAGMIVDTSWDADGIRWRAERTGRGSWSALMVLPWRAIAPTNQRPAVWRANFYRIERPRLGKSQQPVEFSCWSPTLTDPADFHKPARFGILTLA
ncbi:MAG: carbohydrate-binding family 9-like protein [Caldilineaceae bacterium]|nr:carbohydrate-binding family 9-like protein [Caldilineaceae bacterium]